MTKIFRYLRGELNGFYLNCFANVLLKAEESITDFIVYFRTVVFKSNEQTLPNESAMVLDTVRNIGIVAGVFAPKVTQESLLSSIRFTDSHKVNGEEYSERGLLSTASSSFKFFRTDNKTYQTDINTLATKELRTSMVEDGASVVGYTVDGIKAIDDSGNFIPEAVQHEPPVDKAYSEFYGEKYLFLADETPVFARVGADALAPTIEAVQWSKYNGQSMISLIRFAEALCKGYLYLLSFDWETYGKYGSCIVHYGIDEAFEAPDKIQNVGLFQTFVRQRYPQMLFEELRIEVQIDEQGNKHIIIGEV